jgi:hypothetical protein
MINSVLTPFIHGQWHAWQGVGSIVMLSDESTKTLRSFIDPDECVNWLFVNGDKPAARALNQHIKG